MTTSGSSEIFSVVHSQNEAINEARAVDIFESTNPASMIGIKAAAARSRFTSGVVVGIVFAMRAFYQRLVRQRRSVSSTREKITAQGFTGQFFFDQTIAQNPDSCS